MIQNVYIKNIIKEKKYKDASEKRTRDETSIKHQVHRVTLVKNFNINWIICKYLNNLGISHMALERNVIIKGQVQG